MRILIALDATPRCIEIVRDAAMRPWPARSEFLLLHVLDPFPFAKAPLSLERARDASRTELQRIAQELEKAGWKVETRVILGRARADLSKTAALWGADLVLVGSNEAGGLMRALLGSTARSVLRQAPCSVEIVRLPAEDESGRGEAGLRVLVATDGSECSAAALRFVAGRPWPTGSQAKVMAIPEPFMPLGEFPYFESGEIEALNTAALKAANANAEAGAAILKRAALETTTEAPFPEGSPASQIVREAKRWNADIVVLGSHGRRGFDRWTLGSVSEHVALHAPCSVEVIREPLAPKKTVKKNSKRGGKS
jgi:nucleotide-binding universal stress UspA family protein